MTKQDFMDSFNITIRKLTKEDIKEANTTYQRNAKYIIKYHNGTEMYSKNGTLKDIKDGLSHTIKSQ